MEGKTKVAQPQQEGKNYQVITYTNARQIRYLEDFLMANPQPNYKKLDIEGFDQNNVAVNEYDSIYEKLYKKVARDGYLQKTKDITKKSKRGGDQNYYNSMDPFIDDGLLVEEKDARESTFSDFKAVQCSLADFYKSLDYRPQVVIEAKRKPEKMEIPEQQREKIIKRVKNKQKQEDKKLDQ